MKVLYLLRSVEHFFAHETVMENLCVDENDVGLLFDKRWSRGHSDRAVRTFWEKNQGLKIGWISHRQDRWRRYLFTARELLSLSSYISRKGQSAYYTGRWGGYQPLWVQAELVLFGPTKLLLGSKLAKLLLRTFERIVPPDTFIKDWLKKYKPDVIVASSINLRYSEELEYVKAAKALGIPVAVIVLSWDNLTTKGLYHIIPDLVLAWNQNQFDILTTLHRIPKDKIVLIGSTRFDMWFANDLPVMSREAFCRKVGIGNNPFVLYLGSSRNICADETWLICKLARTLRRHPKLSNMNILLRPHPANSKVYRKLRELGVHLWPRKGVAPETEDELQDFYNSMHHCVATVGINNSAQIDAVINDIPSIAILADSYKETQVDTTHFRDMLACGAFKTVQTVEQCVEMIGVFMRGRDPTKESRHQFVQDYIRPRGLDKTVGKIAAQAIELLSLGKSAAEIDKEIE